MLSVRVHNTECYAPYKYHLVQTVNCFDSEGCFSCGQVVLLHSYV